jgi:L-iditol 2-dehydrogenase
VGGGIRSREDHSRPDRHGRGVDIAIEAVGKPQTWEWAANMVRRGGMVNFFGGCPNDSRVHLDTALLHYSEITCKASFHHTPAYIRKALDLVSAATSPPRSSSTARSRWPICWK